MWLLLACADPPPPPVPLAVDAGVADDGEFSTAWALADGTLRVVRDVRPDRGRLLDGEWVSEPGVDPVFAGETVVKGPIPLRWHDTLVVRRPCGDVQVPITLDATPVVSAPYPTCDAHPTGTAGELAAIQRIGLFTAIPVPDTDDAPAGWFTRPEAEAWCAWWGTRLVEEGDGTWLSNGEASIDGEHRALPPSARMEGLGATCRP